MILTMVILTYISHGENTKLNKPLSTFPKQIGKWTGIEERFDEAIYDILGADDSFLCNYRSSDGGQVQLYVGFYQSQSEGEIIHSPKNCMLGAGWGTIGTSLEELIVLGKNPGEVKVIKLILEKGAQRQIALYWFQSRGRFISSEYMQKIYLVVDSIVRHRTDGAFVRLLTPVASGDEEKTAENLKDFTKLLIPVLQEYIPS